MKLIKADYDRRLELPGVGLVRRPVDIDQALTCFANLRTLRIYQFDADSIIDGYAEEDEVFIVVLAGRIELTVSGDNSGLDSRSFTLSAPANSHSEPCVAYLPPHSAYRLIPEIDADIAYARATPDGGRPSAVFAPRRERDDAATTILVDDTTYAKRLRLRLVQIYADQGDTTFTPINESESLYEALIHVRTGLAEQVEMITTPDAEPVLVESWDTVTAAPGDHPNMRISVGSSVLILIVLAL